MNPILRGLISLTVACGVGAGAAALAVQVTHDRGADAVAARAEYEQANTPDERGDRVRNALAGLADDGVHVTADGRAMLSPAGERAIADAIDASATEVRVVVWRPTPYAGGSANDLREQVVDGLAESGQRGVVFFWEGPEEGAAELFGQNGYTDATAFDDFVGDPAKTLPRLIADVDESTRWYDTESDFDYWGGTGGGIAAGLLIGSGILLGVAMLYGVLVLISGRRLPGGWLWRRSDGPG